MHRHGNHVQAPRRKRAIRLMVITLDVARKEPRLHKEAQARAHVGRRNCRPASLRNLVRFRARHRNRQLTHHGMFPRFIERVHLAAQNFHVMRRTQGLHFLEALLFLSICLCVFVSNHQNEVVEFKPQQPHCKRRFLRSFFPKTRLAVANQLEVRPRCETRNLRELAPCKRRGPLAFVVVVLNVLAIVFVFNN